MGHHSGNTEWFSETDFRECGFLPLLEMWIRTSEGGCRDIWVGLSTVALPCTLPKMWEDNNSCSITEVSTLIWISPNKLELFAPYIGLVSTIILAIAITAVFFKRRRKQ